MSMSEQFGKEHGGVQNAKRSHAVKEAIDSLIRHDLIHEGAVPTVRWMLVRLWDNGWNSGCDLMKEAVIRVRSSMEGDPGERTPHSSQEVE